MQQEMTEERSRLAITHISESVVKTDLLRDMHTRALGHLRGEYL